MFSKQKRVFILLGIGIGIIFTNTLYILNPNIEYREYSENEIIEKAKGLGMIFIKDGIEINKEIENIDEADDKGEDVFIEQSSEVEFAIEIGDSLEKISNKLYDVGIIENSEVFKNYAKEKGVAKKLRVGTYNLYVGMDYDIIIDILTKQNL